MSVNQELLVSLQPFPTNQQLISYYNEVYVSSDTYFTFCRVYYESLLWSYVIK